MDFQQLQAFEQIVLQGSFSKAARRLNISQPTISLRIQALEHEIGGPLFVRGGSRLVLTEPGRSFLPYAQAALRAMTTGAEVAQHTAQGKRGRITIGTLPTLATSFFTTTLEGFHRNYPDVDVIIHTGHNQQLMEMLHDGYVQIGFLVGPFFHPDIKPLLHMQEPLVVVVRADHALARLKHVTVADLSKQEQPFLQVDWCADAYHWQSQMTHAHATIEVPPQTAYDFVTHGKGAALLTRAMVSEDLRTGRLLEIPVQDMPVFYRESVVGRWKRDEPLPAVVHGFLDILRAEAREYVMDESSGR